MCRWNLHNLPFVKESGLRYLGRPVSGVNIPWVSVGIIFTSAGWHCEDNFLASVSYLHWGAPRISYSSPAHAVEEFASAMKRSRRALFKRDPNVIDSVSVCLSSITLFLCVLC